MLVRAAALLLVVGAVCVVAAMASATTATKPKTPTYHGMRCPDPVGHRVTECRLGVRGTPDLSRKGWRKVFGAEVTVSEPVTQLVANPAAGNRPDWALLDSLGQPMGRLAYDVEKQRFTLTAFDGIAYRVTTVNMRGHGCAASRRQSRSFALMQLIAPKMPSSGGQAFLDAQAFAGSTAATVFAQQLGGGTGCGPVGKVRGKQRPLANPNVGASAHARLSNGVINTVTEYDAKPPFGNTVYFMSNTTSVKVGGVARGMVRVGTPVSKVDQFRRCDPNSDGTLTWRYVAIHTGKRSRPRLYGWIPARCSGADVPATAAPAPTTAPTRP